MGVVLVLGRLTVPVGAALAQRCTAGGGWRVPLLLGAEGE